MYSSWRESWLAPPYEGQYTNMSTHRRAIRRLNETLFSMNIGFAIALLLRNYLSNFGPGQNAFADFSVRMLIWLNGLFSLAPRKDYEVGLELTFGSWVIALTLIVLLLVQLGERTKAKHIILNHLAGIAAISAIPASLVFIFWPAYVELEIEYWSVPFIPDKFAAAFEVGAAFVCLLLFSLGKWRVPEWCSVILLVLHYTIWSWVVWQLYHPIPEAFFAAALPPCGCLAWILYGGWQSF